MVFRGELDTELRCISPRVCNCTDVDFSSYLAERPRSTLKAARELEKVENISADVITGVNRSMQVQPWGRKGCLAFRINPRDLDPQRICLYCPVRLESCRSKGLTGSHLSGCATLVSYCAPQGFGEKQLPAE